MMEKGGDAEEESENLMNQYKMKCEYIYTKSTIPLSDT